MGHEWWHTGREAERVDERGEAERVRKNRERQSGYGREDNYCAYTLILGARQPKKDSPAPSPSDPSMST